MRPGFLETESVRDWLHGLEPAWTLLDYASYCALQQPPAPPDGAIKLATDLPLGEINQSAVARNVLKILRAAQDGPGLKLTATGNLSRSVVASMVDIFDWPSFEPQQAFEFHRVVNEPDFYPLFYCRHVATAAKLLRKHKGYLLPTASARALLKVENPEALQALLLRAAFWDVDFSSYLGRGLHGQWPLLDIGVVLWSLSIAANMWETPKRLTRLCTIPNIGVLENAGWDSGTIATETRVLRPLVWFNLLESRNEDHADPHVGAIKHQYRKTSLFDRCLRFNVTLERHEGGNH